MVKIIGIGASSGDLEAIIALVRNEEHTYVNAQNLSNKSLIRTNLEKEVKQKIVHPQSAQITRTNYLYLYQHNFQSFYALIDLFFNWSIKNCQDAILAIVHSGTDMEVTSGYQKVIHQDRSMNIGWIETNKCPGLLNLKKNPLAVLLLWTIFDLSAKNIAIAKKELKEKRIKHHRNE